MGVFVFGSNLLGSHGGGAARFALEKHGAKHCEGIGHFGNSYAIPTCDENIRPMSLERIKPHILVFIDYARARPELSFDLTHIGCGIAGYNWQRDMRPLFPTEIPSNVTILEPI